MQQSKKCNPSVAVIGGIEVGKTSIIKSMWPTTSKKLHEKESCYICHEISDNVPGRGIMNYTITEMPPVLFSLPKRWVNDDNNMNIIAKSDTIVFVVSADSIGYKLEMAFLNMLVGSKYYTGQNIVVCLSKSDAILYGKEERLGLEGVKTLFKRKDSLYQQMRLFSNDMDFNVDFVVPVSAILQWNLDMLKEKIWEGVISKINDTTFDEKEPTVVIAGKRGCGKSSTLNSLWNLDLPTNKAVACTKYPMVLHIEDEYEGKPYAFNVVDLPGIAESLDADMQYTTFYKKYIKNATLLICLSQADTRAYLQDEVFYKSLMDQGILTKETKIVLGINQIDLLFKDKEHLNGIELNTISEKNPLIRAKIEDYYGRIYSGIFKDFSNVTEQNVCAFSVLQDWNMNRLKSMIYSNF